MLEYPARHHIPMPEDVSFIWPKALSLEDSALHVMTDFGKLKAVTVAPKINIDHAIEKMKTAGVRSLLVVDEDEVIIGLVTSYDIQSEKTIKISQTTRLKHSEISVEMVMTPRRELRSLDMMSVRDARIGHIVATFKEIERPHILVVARDDNQKTKLRGMFSLSQIRKQLGQQLDVDMPTAHSLAEVVREMA